MQNTRMPRLLCRYIDFCADYPGRRRSLLGIGSCSNAQVKFGHVPLSGGVASVTISNLTAGAPTTRACILGW